MVMLMESSFDIHSQSEESQKMELLLWKYSLLHSCSDKFARALNNTRGSQTSVLTLMLLVANSANTKTGHTGTHEGTQRELSNEYQHDMI